MKRRKKQATAPPPLSLEDNVYITSATYSVKERLDYEYNKNI
jgi:hypothetical protein